MTPARLLVSIHRWVGVVLCLFFAAWFFSGAILIYVPFPALAPADRLERLRAVDAAQIAIAPLQAIHAAGEWKLDRVRIVDVDGRAVYVLHPAGRPVVAVGADDGRIIDTLDAGTASRVAGQFSRHAVARVDGPLDYDQWIVANEFDAFRPFYRARVADASATELYVSARSGEVVQWTTRKQRAWNYVGAVVHWIYPTVLRQHWAVWDKVVWWLAFAGIVVAAIGIWLGVKRLPSRKRPGPWKFSPYRGWLRRHHILGLFGGVLVWTWIFSGWLSMDGGRIFSLPEPPEIRFERFRGASLEKAAQSIRSEHWQEIGAFREAELGAMGGAPLLVTRSPDLQRVHRIVDNELRTAAELPLPLIRSAVQAAWPEGVIESIERPGQSDAYGQLRSSTLPATTVRLKLSDAVQTWVHIDASSGAIISVMDRSRRLYRWLFNGLHSFDFPVLARHRPLWDAVILSLLMLGFAFSTTAVVIGLRRARDSFKSNRHRTRNSL